MAFTTVVTLAVAKKMASVAKKYARKLTYDCCIPTIPAPLIPHAAYKYSKASYHIYFILKWRPLNRAVFADTTYCRI